MKRVFACLLILSGLLALLRTNHRSTEGSVGVLRQPPAAQAETIRSQPHSGSPLPALLPVPRHEPVARFTPDGLVLGSRRTLGWQATLRYAGSNGSCVPEPQADLTTYRHANGVTEWYRRQPEGIEHGFFLAERPAADGGAARVDLTLEGLKAELAGNGRDLLLHDSNGTARISYSKLLVWDANGRELPATMEPTGSGIRIAYHDTDAAYPVTIDPLISLAPQRLGPDPTPAGPEFTNFGGAMAVSGDTLVVSAPMEQTNSGLGAVYVFVKENGTWSQQAKLIPSPDVDWGGEFGHAVAISGDTIVVSAPWDELTNPTEVRDAGTLHVYQRSGTQWSHQAELSAADAATGDGLGHALAIDGDTILAVACGDASNAGNNAGNAYFFHRANGLWTQQAQLPTTSESKGFSPYGYRGKYAALEGDRAVVGARYENAAAKQAAGGIFLFERTGAVWARTAHLHPPENKNAAHYGHSVELRGDSLLVSAPDDGAGRVYIYQEEMGGWSLETTLTTDYGTYNQAFGSAMALQGDQLLIGVPGADLWGGAVMRYERREGAWALADMLFAPEPSAFDEFGQSVAWSGFTALIAAPNDSLPQTPPLDEQGSVFSFDFVEPEGLEAWLMALLDTNASEAVILGEWAALSTNPAAAGLFAWIDTDTSGGVDFEELTAAMANPTASPLWQQWMQRITLLHTLDLDADHQLSRSEIAQMWKPGTQAATIDRYLERAGLTPPISLQAWINASTLPSLTGYAEAKGIRTQRQSVAGQLDLDSNERISREEFAGLFQSNAKASKIDLAWFTATGTPKGGTPPADISIEDFVEASKLPKLQGSRRGL